MAEQLLNTSPERVRARGTREGIVFSLPASLDTDTVLRQVQATLERGIQVFRDAEVILDLGERKTDEAELERIESLLHEHGVRIRSYQAAGIDDRARLVELGRRPIRIVARTGPAERDPAEPRSARGERHARYVRRTVRSGAVIHTDGDLIVMGDVNPGAELVATGDVVVWGTLRGTVHAGASGDRDAVICALAMGPTQLRIESIFARPADGEDSGGIGPYRASVDGSSIVVEPWPVLDRLGR